jgi:hypothetical protein
VLPHLTVTCISKTKRLRAHVYNIFVSFFNKELHYGEFVREFRFTLYNIDELGYYLRQTFSCWKDLFSVVDSEK